MGVFANLLGPYVAAGFLAETTRFVLDWSEKAAGMGIIGVVLFMVLYGAVAMLGMPCLPFTLLGGVVFGVVWGTVAVMGGLAAGAAGGFLLSRYLLRERLCRRLLRYRKLELVDQAVEREGWRIVALLRLCPIPFGLSNYVYGATGIDFQHYMLATLGAMLPGTMVFVYLGSVGRRTLETATGAGGERHPLEISLMVLALLAVVGAFAIVGRIVRHVVQDKLK